MRQDDFDNWRMRQGQLDEYVEKVRRAQTEYPSLQIKLALEVDYLPGHEEWIRDLAGRYPWDYLIGSVHYISEAWAVDNPEQLSRWKEADAFEVWTIYFELLTAAAESGLFEIIGHADLPKKFGIRPRQDCAPLYRAFLDAVKRSNIAIELNTAGLRKDCREIYPSRALLEIAAEKQAPITFGSDAHAPGEVGHAFGEAVALARSVGYTHYRRFTQRRHSEALIPQGHNAAGS
jgi:histidinol-phosphatase (PHP family)